MNSTQFSGVITPSTENVLNHYSKMCRASGTNCFFLLIKFTLGWKITGFLVAVISSPGSRASSERGLIWSSSVRFFFLASALLSYSLRGEICNFIDTIFLNSQKVRLE